jgi:hypothetical protein
MMASETPGNALTVSGFLGEEVMLVACELQLL